MASAHTLPELPPTDSETVRFIIVSDIHDRRYLPSEMIQGDVLLFAGDFCNKPFNIPTSQIPELAVQDHIDTLNHLKTWDCPIKVFIPGNHDHWIEEAFAFDHPAPRSNSITGAARGRLSEEDAARLREAYTSRPEEGFYFEQHGTLSINPKQIEGQDIKLFLSGMSHWRRTDGYTFDEKDSGDLWEGIEGADIVMTHGPMFDDMTTLEIGQHVLDRDTEGPAGSQSLRNAIMTATPSLVVSGHIHNSYGSHPLTYPDGSTGLYVNPAAVISGFHWPAMPTDGTQSEYLTPRPPIVVDYNTRTKKSTLMSSWDGTIRGETVEMPHWVGPVPRASVGKSKRLTNAKLYAASLKAISRLGPITVTDVERDDWMLAKCLRDWRDRAESEVSAGLLSGLRLRV